MWADFANDLVAPFRQPFKFFAFHRKVRAGIFGIGGAIHGVFLSAFDLPKAICIAITGPIGLLVDYTRIITYFAGGAKLPSSLWWSLFIFIPVSLIGAEIGKH